MIIKLGTEADKNYILEKYPHTSQVIYGDGYLVTACENYEIIGFAWIFTREIPIVNKTENFINVIDIFSEENCRKGIASLMVQKIIELARERGSYQIRAYCDINNVSSHMLWLKNGFSISPVKMPDNQIVGSYVAYVL